LARFVQFYNTPQCSARAYFDNTYGQAANGGVPADISYDAWITWVLENSANKATKLYIGLPGAPGAAGDNGNFYLTPTEAEQLITNFKCKYAANFGGVMLWEAT
jgi:chitinase